MIESSQGVSDKIEETPWGKCPTEVYKRLTEPYRPWEGVHMSKGKGGRVKATWHASVRKVFRHIVHTYEGNVSTGSHPVVTMSLSLERDPDRVVCVNLSVREARKWAHALTVMADKIERNEW